jgi:hypothetical protein
MTAGAAVAQQPDHTSSADSRCNLIACLIEPACDDLSGATLLHREFRVGVQILVDGLEPGEQIVRDWKIHCPAFTMASQRKEFVRNTRQELGAKTHG